MPTIIKSKNREFKEDPRKIDCYQLFSDVSILGSGVNPKNLFFDMRSLNPGKFSFPYHFHRNAEELFMIISGSITLRTPKGLEIVSTGDILFFEMGETGAHQLFNHCSEPCIYLDIRTFSGIDICEYPDSNKILTIPSIEVFEKESKVSYFKGEENINEKWEELSKKNKK